MTHLTDYIDDAAYWPEIQRREAEEERRRMDRKFALESEDDPVLVEDEPTAPQPAAQVHTKESIRELLARNDTAVGRALVALLARQTADEQRSETTKEDNGVGFNGTDGHIMTSMAKQFQRRGFLTEKQLAYLRAPCGKSTRIGKYARQLAEIANARAQG